MTFAWFQRFRILSASHRLNIVVLTYLLSTQILTVIASSHIAKPANQQARSDSRWYDKSRWSNSASTKSYVNVEGSGNGDVVSDLDDSPRGIGPDDEDSIDSGSGGTPLHETTVEGSGAGPLKPDVDRDHLRTTASPSATTFYHTHLTTQQNATTTIASLQKKAEDHEVHTIATPPSDDVIVDHVSTMAATTLSVETTKIMSTTTTASTPALPPWKAPGGLDEDEDDEDEDEDLEEDNDDTGIDELEPSIVDTSGGGYTPPILAPPETTTDRMPVIFKETPATTPPTMTSSARPHDIFDEAPPPPVDKRPWDRWGLEWLLNPGVLTAVIGGAFVGLLAAILLVMLVVYRMRKKDEGSYVLEESKAPPAYPYAYQKAPAREFYA